jgi:hypothetical protein
MQSLIVEATSHDSAQALYEALIGFEREVSGSDEEGYRVAVTLGGADQEVIAVLAAIQKHVSEHRDGPARLDLDGRNYTVHPE